MDRNEQDHIIGLSRSMMAEDERSEEDID